MPEIAQILRRMKDVRVAFVGDMCLDMYWEADMRLSLLSKETPHHPLPIISERYSPGGGANVAANLAALGVGSLHACTILGDDWRTMLLLEALKPLGMQQDGIIRTNNWLTAAYCKPIRCGISDVKYEDPRIDFENRVPPPQDAESRLLAKVNGLRGRVDAIAVTEQFAYSCITQKIRDALCELARQIPVVVDSREGAHIYRHAIVKPNEYEAAHLFGANIDEAFSASSLLAAAQHISACSGASSIITLGERGAFCYDGETGHHILAHACEPPIDIVGAGDTFLAAVTASLGAGSSLADAVSIGNAAAAVTVKKCGTTGTASPEELLAVLQRRQ